MKKTIEGLEDVILELKDSKQYDKLKSLLSTINPTDIAALFDELPKHTLPLLFRLLPKDNAAETFVEMYSDMRELLIHSFSDSELKELVDELYVDDAADIVEEMPSNVVTRILSQADPETRRMINEILKYPEDSAGSIMTTEYVNLRPTMRARDAIEHIRRTGVDKETINTCYVTDQSKVLIGTVSIRMLILADEQAVISDFMEPNIIYAGTLEDKEDVARMFVRYNFSSLPVVDKERWLVGIVTVDDACDVLVDEATEDIEKMAAITPTDTPYLKTSVISIWKSRIPWLLLLMISATLTGMIITSFEHALAASVALTAYIPMLMDTGGNSGSQSSVTVIRSISLDELAFKDIFRVLWKELRVSVLCAGTLAVVNFAKLIWLDRVGVPVAATVCLTLAATVIMAKLMGCLLPMLAKRVGFDPAVCASPFITTIVDALSLLIYFKFATIILRL